MEQLLDNFDSLCLDKNLIQLKEKILLNQRLDLKDAEAIMLSEDINSLGVLARYKKFLKDGDKIYFVVNRHINPTNVCALSKHCKFCAFGVKKGTTDAYEMKIDQIF